MSLARCYQHTRVVQRRGDAVDRNTHWVVRVVVAVSQLQSCQPQFLRRLCGPALIIDVQALAASVNAFLEWIETNELAYRRRLQSAGSVPAVRALIDDRTLRRNLEEADPHSGADRCDV